MSWVYSYNSILNCIYNRLYKFMTISSYQYSDCISPPWLMHSYPSLPIIKTKLLTKALSSEDQTPTSHLRISKKKILLCRQIISQRGKRFQWPVVRMTSIHDPLLIRKLKKPDRPKFIPMKILRQEDIFVSGCRPMPLPNNVSWYKE